VATSTNWDLSETAPAIIILIVLLLASLGGNMMMVVKSGLGNIKYLAASFDWGGAIFSGMIEGLTGGLIPVS